LSDQNILQKKDLLKIKLKALEAAANGVIITDRNGIILWANPAITHLTGYSLQELVGQSTSILKAGKHSEEFYNNLWSTIKKGEVWRGDIINRKKNGDLYYEDMTITPVSNTAGEIQNYIAIKQDITHYRKAATALMQSEERFRQLINSVNAYYYVSEQSDQTGFKNVYVSENMEELTGYPANKFLQDWDFWNGLIHKDDKAIINRIIPKLLAGENQEIEYRLFDRSGTVKWISEKISVDIDAVGKRTLYATISDITTKKENENRIRHLATHDPLTDLPNRIMFKEILEHAITFAKRNNSKVAVFFLDVDDFKSVNDTYGHYIGDLLLKSIAERLSNNLRKYDTISRISGDEFTLVAEQLKNSSNGARIAEKIHEFLHGKYQLGQHRLDVSVSIGGSIYPDHGEDYATLIRLADTAMYQAKNSPDRYYVMYSPEHEI